MIAAYPNCTPITANEPAVMAMNPRWCASLDEWKRTFAIWIDRGDPASLLAASIFFDFRPLFGDAGLANGLREEVVQRAERNGRFLKQMADNALRNRPPAGRGIVDSLFGEGGPARVDLKMHGTVPFVDAARIWALAAGLHETNTAERLKRLGESGRLPEGDVRAELFGDGTDHGSGYVLVHGGWGNTLSVLARLAENAP